MILTEREAEILQLVAEGRRNKEIAVLLYISPRTVETLLQRIYKRNGCRSRAQAVRMAQTERRIAALPTLS